MPNRYTRDQIILIGLQQAQLPNLEAHDAPEGVVKENAYSIQWLQSAMDNWYHTKPFSQTVVEVEIDVPAGTSQLQLPEDFILDVTNGVLARKEPNDPFSYFPTRREPLGRFIKYRLNMQKNTDAKHHLFYCISGYVDGIEVDEAGTTQATQHQLMQITPTPRVHTAVKLNYYQLPKPLESHHRTRFPDDLVLIDYIRMKAWEWQGTIPPGSADAYAQKKIANMKAVGLLNEPENDEIPFDEDVYHRGRGYSDPSNPFGWMGSR